MEIKYDFGEKKEEYIKGVGNIPVELHTPKYKEAKAKAIELLESDKYKNVLKPSDFWILVNTYANKTKAMYSGLIISHDGCLKINDSLDEELKFDPAFVKIDKEGYNDSLVFIYQNPSQNLYEVGEISKANCKNDYPYAMALKRCFDRVVLKNSKIAYSGIYSDSESDEFIKRTDDNQSYDYDEPMDDEQLTIIANFNPDMKDALRKQFKKDFTKLTKKEAEVTINSALKKGLIKTKEQKEKEIKEKEDVF